MIQTSNYRGWLRGLFLLLGILLSFSLTAQAQDYYVIASQPDADSSEYFYEEGATLYMTVYSQNLDFNNMKKMKWEIEKDMDYGHEDGMMDDSGMDFEGVFTNNMDGSFSASFDLSQLPMAGLWKWKAELEDEHGNEVKFKAAFSYIHPSDDSVHQYLELKGIISEISGDTLFIGSYAFVVDSGTIIIGYDENRLSFSDLMVGDYVEIEGLGLYDKVYLAVKIELEDKDDYEDDGHHEMEFKGKIESITDSSIVINGNQFKITAQTLILNRHEMTIRLSDLAVGMFVEVKARLMNREMIALKIEVEDYDDYAYKFEIEGMIDSLNTNYLIIGGQKVYFDSTTVVKLSHHDMGSVSDLQVGQYVEVKVILTADGALWAIKIEIEDSDNYSQEIKFKGVIDSVGVNFLIVSDRLVYVDDSTEIYWAHNVSMSFSELQKGLVVKVEGILQNDGSILAQEIKVKELWNNYIEVEGVVESIDADGFTVQGVYFYVDSTTLFFTSHYQILTFNDLKTGDWVEVKALPMADGSLVALKVHVEDGDKTHLSVTGEIQSITMDSIRVNNLNFAIDSSTIVYDLQDAQVDISALKVGQIVEVKALILQDGTFQAVKIEIEYDPDMVSVTSSLGGKTESSIIILNTEYTITSNTVILDSSFNVIDYTSLQPGDEVTVWAVSSSGGNEALQIQTLSTSSVTAIENQSQVIRGFELKQNYPNPFNPTTTIEFSLNQSGFEKVSLTVYNILGKKVKTLYNGVLDRGTYRFEWNGTNEANQPVASGLYFYRLQVKNQASVKQMILIK